MQGEHTAAIYLAAILGLAIGLIVLYVCIVKGCCWCQKTDKKDTELSEYAALASEEDKSSNDEDDETDHFSVMPTEPTESDSEIYKSEPNLRSLHPHIGVSLDLTASDPGIALSAYGDQRPKKKFNFRKKKLASTPEEFSTDARLIVTLKHSSSDLFLLVSIHNVIGLPEKVTSSMSNLVVKLLFLPDKRYASKTKYGDIKSGRVDQSFKFAAVKRSDLFQSAIRFRVYGKSMKLGVQIGSEKFLGEMTLQLADVAQSSGSITTERKLGPKCVL